MRIYTPIRLHEIRLLTKIYSSSRACFIVAARWDPSSLGTHLAARISLDLSVVKVPPSLPMRPAWLTPGSYVLSDSERHVPLLTARACWLSRDLLGDIRQPLTLRPRLPRRRLAGELAHLRADDEQVLIRHV